MIERKKRGRKMKREEYREEVRRPDQGKMIERKRKESKRKRGE